MNECITLHHTKPWVPGFKGVLIRPLQSAIDAGTVNPDWLSDDPIIINDKTWYKPTLSPSRAPVIATLNRFRIASALSLIVCITMSL